MCGKIINVIDVDSSSVNREYNGQGKDGQLFYLFYYCSKGEYANERIEVSRCNGNISKIEDS